MEEALIQPDEEWKKEVADENAAMQVEEEQVWITYDEVKRYLSHLATSLFGMVNHIENSIKLMEENITKGEDKDEHDDKD